MFASDISTLYFSCVATGDECRMCSSFFFSAGDKQVSYLCARLVRETCLAGLASVKGHISFVPDSVGCKQRLD